MYVFILYKFLMRTIQPGIYDTDFWVFTNKLIKISIYLWVDMPALILFLVRIVLFNKNSPSNVK